MARTSAPSREVKTSHTVFEIVETIHELGGATLAELSEELDFAKSTIHDHLTTLMSNEYVVKRDEEYTLSLKFLSHGMFAKHSFDIAKAGQPVIDTLAEKTGESVWIIVEENGTAVYLCHAKGENAIQTHAEVGGRSELHHLGAGKVLLAYMDDDRVAEIIAESGLPQLTPHTNTDPDELRSELAAIRDQQYAINDQETVVGLRAIAAPVLDNDGTICAVCVSGPANRLTTETCLEKIKPHLLEATNELELRMQYPE